MTALLAAALAVTSILLAGPGTAATDPRLAWRSRTRQLRDRAPQWAHRVLPARRARRRDQQLPEALDRAAAALRAGDSVGVALARVAAATPAPLGAELRSVARAISLGASAADSLRTWAGARGASADVQLVATALAIGSRAGGQLARAVDGVASTLRERHELQREVHALATQARASAGVLAAAPLAFAGLVATIEPDAALFLVTEPVGLLCLAGGAGLEAAGALWMARITRGAG